MSTLYNVLRTDLSESRLVGLAFRDLPLAEKAAQNWRNRCPAGTFVVTEVSEDEQTRAAEAMRHLYGKVKGF